MQVMGFWVVMPCSEDGGSKVLLYITTWFITQMTTT